jgi:hypothetical protein
VTALALLGTIALVATPVAAAGKPHHHRHKPAGVKGVVLDGTCPGLCAEPPPPSPPYTGSVTVTVARASDGTVVASQETGDGHFRMRVKRGAYDVSAVPPTMPPCEPGPTIVCPAQAQQSAIVAPCMTGETQRVHVHRHRFTRVELHVRNVCVV